MGTGNTKSDGTSWIPFQRMSKTRTDIKKLTTISVPQMITSDRTKRPSCSGSTLRPASASSTT